MPRLMVDGADISVAGFTCRISATKPGFSASLFQVGNPLVVLIIPFFEVGLTGVSPNPQWTSWKRIEMAPPKDSLQVSTSPKPLSRDIARITSPRPRPWHLQGIRARSIDRPMAGVVVKALSAERCELEIKGQHRIHQPGPPPSRSTRSEIGGIGGPHPLNKNDDLMMDDEMRTWTWWWMNKIKEL